MMNAHTKSVNGGADGPGPDSAAPLALQLNRVRAATTMVVEAEMKKCPIYT